MNRFWQQISDRKHWPKFIRRVNVSFRRIKRTEVLTFLLFVAIAAFFWTVQTSREETVQDFIVTLVVTDLPQDVVLTTHVPKQLRVSLSDTNAKLFNYRYNHRMQSLSVDFERYADAIGNFRISAAELQSLLSAQLISTTRIVAVSPSLIDARFAQTEGRKYAVRVKGSYLPADNHRLRQVSIQPDSVIINAPTSVLDTLRYVYAIGGNHWDLTDTLRQTLDLELPIGVKATPAQVRVMVPVVQYVEKVFPQIVVQTKNVPQDKHLIVFPYAVTLSCLVDFSNYRNVTSEHFEVSVNYDSIRTDAAGQRNYLPITVKYNGPSQSVTNIAIQPDMAEYVIE